MGLYFDIHHWPNWIREIDLYLNQKDFGPILCPRANALSVLFSDRSQQHAHSLHLLHQAQQV